VWKLTPPPGFSGLDHHKPLECYYRLLPHWRQEGATYYVTIRLGDSLPQSALHELEAFKKEWERIHPPPRSDELMDEMSREVMRRVERWLDQGMGACVLREPRFAKFVVNALHYFDVPSVGTTSTAFSGRPRIVDPTPSKKPPPVPRYELGCYVIMPDHLHAVVRPLDGQAHPLEDLVGSWKQYAALRINPDRESDEHLWQIDAYDRIIRDEEHLLRVIHYIGRNPERAGLRQDEYSIWVRPEWEALGWTFEGRPIIR
jgi:putative transposase